MTLINLDTITLSFGLLVNAMLLLCGHIGVLLYIVTSHIKTVLKLFVYQVGEAVFKLREAGAWKVYTEIRTQVNSMNGSFIKKIVSNLAAIKLSEQYALFRQPDIAIMPPRMQIAVAMVDMFIHAGIVMSIAHFVICPHQDRPAGHRYRHGRNTLSACRIIFIYYVVACVVLIGSRFDLT